MYAVYGCSMGGSIALMTALGQKIKIRHCVMDDGITPYQLPWIVTRFIALKDYLMMMRYADSLLVCKRRGEGEKKGSSLYENEIPADTVRSITGPGTWRTGITEAGIVCGNDRKPLEIFCLTFLKTANIMSY